MPPTLVDHRQPRSDPRPGPRLCRRLHRGRRADHLSSRREGNVHGFINLRRAIPSAADDIARRRRGAEAAARRGGGDDRRSPPTGPRSAVMLINARAARSGSASGSITRSTPGRCRRAGSTRARTPLEGALSRARGGDRHRAASMVEIVARGAGGAALRPARGPDRQGLEGALARAAADLVPDALPRRRRGREHRDRPTPNSAPGNGPSPPSCRR